MSVNLLAHGAGKTVGMVGFPKSSHDFPFHKLPTAIAASPIHPLVIHSTEVVSILNEKATLSQVTSTYCEGKATRNKSLQQHQVICTCLEETAVYGLLMTVQVRNSCPKYLELVVVATLIYLCVMKKLNYYALYLR